MAYENIDPTLDDWASNAGIAIIREPNSPHRRYFYISDDYGASFQIVIEPEKEGSVRIDLHLIEGSTFEFHDIIEINSEQFDKAIEFARFCALKWMSVVRM